MIKYYVTGILCLIGIVLSLKTQGQMNGPEGWPGIVDTNAVDFDYRTSNYAPFGGAFTPNGTFKVLVVYAGLYEPGVFDETEGNAYINGWPTNSGFPDYIHNTVPNYAQGGTPLELFFNDTAQLFDPQYADIVNLTRYYYTMSNGKFKMLGDVFKDPDPNSATYGQPIRINVDPTGAANWQELGMRVKQKMFTLYGSDTAIWNNMWLPYDNRTNSPAFQYDNSVSSPDNKIDFIVIHWRYSTSWIPQPLDSMETWANSGNAYAPASLGSVNGYNFNEGFVIINGEMSAMTNVSFYPHEFAHRLYCNTHYLGANSVIGDYFNRPDAGWGMMASNCKTSVSANSWERWILGWVEPRANGEHTDLQNADSLNATGIYTLRDFLNTGDAIRIKVPNTTSTYLWIENHTKTNLFDFKPWAGHAPSPQGEAIPNADRGIYMFVENEAPSRNSFNMNVTINGIKPINAQGNYDYTHSALPLESSPDTIDPAYYWHNIVYTYQRTNENPISGTNPWITFTDDYRKYKVVYDVNHVKHVVLESPPNGSISFVASGSQGCSYCETFPMVRETNGTNSAMTYANTFGINNEADSLFGRRSDIFQVGDEVSKSGIVPVLNMPTGKDPVGEYVLNGLRINILSEDTATGNITLQIEWDDYDIRSDKRWCGKIGLYNLTGDSYEDLVINEGMELKINKTRVPNRKTKVNNEFFQPSYFTSYGAYIHQLDSSTVKVEEGSTLKLNSGSKYRLATGASLKILSGSNFIMESGSELIVDEGASVIIDSSSFFHFNGGNIVLSGNNSLIDLSGRMDIIHDVMFTFTGNGYLRLSSPLALSENVFLSYNSGFSLNGSGKSDKILEIDQESFYTARYISLTNGLVYMKKSDARIYVLDTSSVVNINNVKFSPLTANRTNHRGLWLFGQNNCTVDSCDFEKGQYGIYDYITDGNQNIFTNCTFTNNNYGIFYHGKAVQASYCSFNQNIYGYFGEYTTSETNLIDHCTFTSNTAPIRYINCEGDIMLRYSQLTYANGSSVYVTGNHNFNMLCSEISGVAGAGYGLNIAEGANLNMGTGAPTTGGNKVTAVAPLRFTNAYYFNVDWGWNYINKTGGYHIYGTVSKWACQAPYPNIYARNNQWVPSTPVKYVTKYNCTPTEAYTVNCTFPITYVPCGGSFMSQGNSGSDLSISDMNYVSGTTALQTSETTGNWDSPFTFFGQVLNGQIPTYTNGNVNLWENSWEKMRHCLKEMYTAKQLSGTNNSKFVQTIAANNKMSQLQAGNYYRKFQVDLEKATLYRMAGDYNTAITLLTPLTADTSASNREQAEAWLCTVKLEKQISEGTIDKKEIEKARAECPMYHDEMITKSMEIENNNSADNEKNITESTSWLNIVPNPTAENSILFVNTGSDIACEVEITDLFGRLIKTVKVEAGYTETPLTFTEFSEGIYIVSLMKNGQTIAVNRVTIAK